jgi:cytosine/adenosine deaminase-related metal-dependent hydrolase
MVDIMARQEGRHTPEEAAACALMTGLQNLAAGNTALIDQCSLPQTRAHIYAVAQAYEDLGLRAWVFPNLSDLPSVVYTREAFPDYPDSIPTSALPPGLQALNQARATAQEQLAKVGEIIRGWEGNRVKIGVGLTNPVWCSDELLEGAAKLANELGSPIQIHAEESPVQREVHFAQWGTGGVRRLAERGVLSPRTLVAHAVQVDDDDIELLASHGCSVVHNPLSNLKLQNGIAPIGKLMAAGINVCVGSDGHSSGDSQSLFTALKMITALGSLNGIQQLPGIMEEISLEMATTNGRRLWFEGDTAQDYVTFSEPIGPYGYVWDDPMSYIAEVYIDGVPRLAAGRELVNRRRVRPMIVEMMEKLVTPDREARVEEFVGFLADRDSPA